MRRLQKLLHRQERGIMSKRKEKMKNVYVNLDGFDDYQQWESTIGPLFSIDDLIEDVRAGLKELGGGHADIWDAETDELISEIEV